MDDQPAPRRRWTASAAGLVIGLIIGLPLGAIALLVLMQIVAVMISL